MLCKGMQTFELNFFNKINKIYIKLTHKIVKAASNKKI